MRTTMRFPLTPIRMATNNNNKTKQKTTGAGEDVEKLGPSYTAGGDVKWCGHCGNNMEVLQKIRNILTI